MGETPVPTPSAPAEQPRRPAEGVIDFTSVGREIRSIVSRRRELLTLLGSIFAGLGIFLNNVLHKDLPERLKVIEAHAFVAYGIMLLVPSLLLALRLAKLNAGLTLNGILYNRLMLSQDFNPKPRPITAPPAPNIFGVSFQMFLLTDLLAGFSAALLALASSLTPLFATAIGVGVAVFWLILYFVNHYRAARFALRKSATDRCTAFVRNEWEEHQAASLEDANHDMIAVLALVGLIVFSSFEGLSGLGKADGSGTELPSEAIQQHGPTAYGILMTATCVLGLVAYLRLRLAVGQRSLELDPSDRPFRPLRLTDSLLGYMLLAFLFAVSVHMLVTALGIRQETAFVIDAVAFGLAVVLEQALLVVEGRYVRAG